VIVHAGKHRAGVARGDMTVLRKHSTFFGRHVRWAHPPALLAPVTTAADNAGATHRACRHLSLRRFRDIYRGFAEIEYPGVS
jgi:hypothetical protein